MLSNTRKNWCKSGDEKLLFDAIMKTMNAKELTLFSVHELLHKCSSELLHNRSKQAIVSYTRRISDCTCYIAPSEKEFYRAETMYLALQKRMRDYGFVIPERDEWKFRSVGYSLKNKRVFKNPFGTKFLDNIEFPIFINHILDTNHSVFRRVIDNITLLFGKLILTASK